MDKKSPFFTASVASVVYFIILIMLKYALPPASDFTGKNVAMELPSILLGAVVFWIVIFLVHHFLKRRYSD